MAMPICRRLFKQALLRAFSFAKLKAGSSRAARIAITAITTSNSISVNPSEGRALRVRAFICSMDEMEHSKGRGVKLWAGSAEKNPVLEVQLYAGHDRLRTIHEAKLGSKSSHRARPPFLCTLRKLSSLRSSNLDQTHKRIMERHE